MSKFAGRPARYTSPIQTTGASGTTYEGGTGYARDAKSELFLLAVTNMVSEDTFYESGKARDTRFVELVQTVTRDDPDWLLRFVPWLRDVANMRSASVVAAAEYVAAGGSNGRQVVSKALLRADEPAEMLAYWRSEHGRSFPKSIKRGVADACTRLYNERNLLRYDGTNREWRFADVIDLVHPRPNGSWQSALFKYALDTRHKREDAEFLQELPIISTNRMLAAIPEENRRDVLRTDPEVLNNAGFSWERLSSWLPGGMDAEAWETIIPSMGYMALLRNLRNFDQAGVSDEVKQQVVARLTDPEAVAKSRQFPYRFYSAWKAAKSLNWGSAIERALQLSLDNLPQFSGNTLILIDVSGSMYGRMSGRSEAMRHEVASLFGIALAHRCKAADVYAFDQNLYQLSISPTDSIIRQVDYVARIGGGGTDTWGALNRAWHGHDRIVILTDEQVGGGWYYRGYDTAPREEINDVPMYTFNLAGYEFGAAPSGTGNWHTFGGLNDAGFTVIAALESRRDGGWPF